MRLSFCAFLLALAAGCVSPYGSPSDTLLPCTSEHVCLILEIENTGRDAYEGPAAIRNSTAGETVADVQLRLEGGETRLAIRTRAPTPGEYYVSIEAVNIGAYPYANTLYCVDPPSTRTGPNEAWFFVKVHQSPWGIWNFWGNSNCEVPDDDDDDDW